MNPSTLETVTRRLAAYDKGSLLAVLQVPPAAVLGCVVAALGLAFALGLLARLTGTAGPSTIPIIGNIHQMPRTGMHLWLANAAKKYGPVLSLKVGSSNMVVLSSGYHVTQLLDKRSSTYSNRPPSYIVGGQVFGNDHPMMMNADERWRHRRKLYFRLLQESKCNGQHINVVEAEAAQLVQDIILEPESLMNHPGRYSNSIIMTLVFGIRTPRHDTPHFKKLQKIMTDLSALGEVGSTPPVDVLSFFKYLPENFWGNWKTRAQALRQEVESLYGSLVGQALKRRERIGSLSTFIDAVYGQEKLSQHEVEIMCGNLLEGGTDTMATTILVLLQAMSENPDILRTAQAEIDSVVATERSPLWSDFEKLPYVNMVIKELLRWRPPAPSAFPHATAKDDAIDGMKIPAKSTVIVNIWGLHHDQERYPDSSVFNPLRFEGKTETSSVYANAGDHENRDHFSYGTGRRICPGIHLAERGLFVAVSKILWAFDIKYKLDKKGKPIRIDTNPATAYRDGFLNQCRAFEVGITARSDKHREIIAEEVGSANAAVFANYM
ncbi:hypothetical protein S7711_04695 [Stachybotrys chartarum IBT 7711]|uniref:Cytochrome P450 n=1 Tax=Stachybotrys chartarum (strain CBS 109288 / IBT 7711) TaxID=1280523 RepID=A0A084ANY2_STACB|nr:hypothetical protein S7711_04695 [Stachybotrys chartarum IBT 7711]KFA53752.1 hypothetical protein S40293_01622 [Stachybotrys chartarum IBT 40293]KFA73036.1 hypothetical protein S40288_03262 [Stachybotrys chartarum IBT 40288]